MDSEDGDFKPESSLRRRVRIENERDKGLLAPLRRWKRNTFLPIQENEKYQQLYRFWQSPAARFGSIVLIALLMLALVYSGRGFLHGLYWWWRGSPIILAFLVGAAGMIAVRNWIGNVNGMFGLLLRGGLAAALFFAPFFGYLALMEPMADVQIIDALNSTELASPPASLDVRYVALEVAQTVGGSMMADSRFNAGDVDPFDYAGRLSYSVPRVPNGFYNRYFGHPNGIMLIEANNTELKPDTRIIEQEFMYGEGMGWFAKSSIYYQIYSRHWWCDVPEVYYLPIGSDLVQMAPYLEYDFSNWVFVPRWAGVFVFHANGTIEQLSKEQAISDPRFFGHRLFPEKMARNIAEAWYAKGGIWNSFTTHVDMAVIDDPSGSNNIMPYLMPTTMGDAWVVAYKPYSSNTDAVYKIQYVDARTGDVRTYNVVGEGWIGPNKAVEIAKNLHRMWDWNTFGAVEALPVFTKRGEFFWQVSLVNAQSKTALVETVLVNGKTQALYQFTSYASLKQFLDTGKYVPAGTEEQAQGPNVAEMTLAQLGDMVLKIYQRIMELSSQTA